LAFPLFAGSLSVSHGYAHIVEMGQPVKIGGFTVEPGMLLHGDEHGVQHIPLSLADRLPAIAAQLANREDKLRAILRQPGVTVEELRAALSAPQN
jgi:regulator of RNase E activity RraA